MGEISRRTWWLLAAFVMAASTLTVVLQANTLGFWGPWETEIIDTQLQESIGDDADDRLQAAAESAAVPTRGGEPVAGSWLQAAWMSMVVDDEPVADTGQIGTTERRARIPLVIMMVLMLGAAVVWIRDYLDESAAAMVGVMLATSPVVVLGSIFLSGPLVVISASTLAIIAFFQCVYSEGVRWPYPLLACLAMIVVALDGGGVSVVSTLTVIVALAVAQALNTAGQMAPDDEADRPKRTGLAAVPTVVALIAAVIALGWGWWTSLGYEEAVFRPDVLVLLWLVVPSFLLVGLAVAARHTPVGRRLIGWPGLLVTAGGIIPLAILASGYAAAVPPAAETLETSRPALEFVFEQHASEPVAAGDFSWWIRQIGFGLFPYLMLLLPAGGYLVWKLRTDTEARPIERTLALLCVIWPIAAFVVAVPAAHLGHTAFPAFFPLVMAMGWMVSDAQFWRHLRIRPALYLAVGVVAIFTLLVLLDDVDEFPFRLVEFVFAGQQDLPIPDDLLHGTMIEQWGRATLLLVAAYFVGIISWLVFTFRDAKRAGRWLGKTGSRIMRRWRQRNNDPSDHTEADDGTEPAQSTPPQNDSLTAGQRRMAEREQWRDSPNPTASVARRLERLPGLVGVVVAVGIGFLGILFVSVIDELDDRLSNRAVVETYLQVAEDDEPLWYYRFDTPPDDYYLRGIDELERRRDFEQRYRGDDRLFVVIPQDELASLHSRIRRNHGENLATLAQAGDTYLVSNRLEEGKHDVSPISKYVLDEPPDDLIELQFESDGETVHPQFNRRLEFLGYRLDRAAGDAPPVYAWGDTMEITQFFRVERRIPRSYEIFMHIDLGGHRIHGDHDPLDGVYPTDEWVTGDIIKNVHRVEIDRFVAPGLYTVYTGFYRGDNRMNVRPDDAHDGEDRVEMTTIEVVPF